LKWYWNQPNEQTKSYRLEIVRNPIIQPKPRLIRIKWSDDDDARMRIWRAVQTNKLRQERGQPLAEQIQTMQPGDKRNLPAAHALMCMLAGMERYPYRRHLLAARGER